MEAKVFDSDAALRRLGGDQELFQELVQFFFEDVPGLVQEIRRGTEQKDAVAIQRAAHSLKGLVANFNAESAVEAAFRLEWLGQGGRVAETREALENLERHLGVLMQALASYHRPAANQP